MSTQATRRRFLSDAATCCGLLASGVFTSASRGSEKPRHKVERLGVGAIGLRYQGSVIAHKAQAHGDVVALCDVDQLVSEQKRKAFGGAPAISTDYHDLLSRKDIDVVMVGTPDHWHTKMVIDACRAGKDVYVEKPLTLTIDEGKQLTKVIKNTGRVVQVGSWQRSDERFRLAVELIRQGRIGKLKRVDVVLGKNKTGGPFKRRDVPRHLNWNLWQGQTPNVSYIEERSHYTFRWWYEYSGGQMTDWGAHHVDIAQWGINSFPVAITGTAKYPIVQDGYNVALDFAAQYKFANGVDMSISDKGRNGVMFTGELGRVFVNRGTVSGKPVEDLKNNTLPREKFVVYPHDNLNRPPRVGKLEAIINHMGNFFDCVESRKTPISDVESQHRSASTCHLGNIAMKLGRSLTWDPGKEEFPNDNQANSLIRREQRAGFEYA
jgi:predicted dehydrogenase